MHSTYKFIESIDGPAENQSPSPPANVENESNKTKQQLPAPHVEPVAGPSTSAPAQQILAEDKEILKKQSRLKKSKSPARSSAYQMLSEACENMATEGEPPTAADVEEVHRLCDEATMHIRAAIELLLQPREPAPLCRPPSKLRTRCINGHWQPLDSPFVGCYLNSQLKQTSYAKELHGALVAAAKESLVAE